MEEIEAKERLMREGKPVKVEPIGGYAMSTLSPGISVVTKESVERALNEIDSASPAVPRNRASTNYCLITRGRHYPPKYVILRARKIQAGIGPHGLRGGPRTNNQLKRLGYVVEGDHCGNTCNFAD